MDLPDTRAHIIEWYLRIGLAQHDHIQNKLAWLADHWYLAADAEFARQAQRAYQRLVASDILIEWRPRSWAAARVTVVIAAAPHDLLALVPAVVDRGWKPSTQPCALIVLDDWNPAWWTHWAVPTTTAGRLNACDALVGEQRHDNVVLDAREASVAQVRDALRDMGESTRIVVVRDRSDVPLDDIDTVVCACACRQAPESRLHMIDRYRARVYYKRRSARPMAMAFAPWAGTDHDDGRAPYRTPVVGDHGGNDDDNNGDLTNRDRSTDYGKVPSLPERHLGSLADTSARPRGGPVPMRNCASLDCGCCSSFTAAWAETRERCPFVGGCASCD